jgi:hypothetical protein
MARKTDLAYRQHSAVWDIPAAAEIASVLKEQKAWNHKLVSSM